MCFLFSSNKSCSKYGVSTIWPNTNRLIGPLFGAEANIRYSTASIRQHLNYYLCHEAKHLLHAALCMTVVHNDMSTDTSSCKTCMLVRFKLFCVLYYLYSCISMDHLNISEMTYLISSGTTTSTATPV